MICSKCATDKDISNFYKDSRSTGEAYKSECKECIRSRMKAWRASNKDKVLEYNRKRKIIKHQKFDGPSNEV